MPATASFTTSSTRAQTGRTRCTGRASRSLLPIGIGVAAAAGYKHRLNARVAVFEIALRVAGIFAVDAHVVYVEDDTVFGELAPVHREVEDAGAPAQAGRLQVPGRLAADGDEIILKLPAISSRQRRSRVRIPGRWTIARQGRAPAREV